MAGLPEFEQDLTLEKLAGWIKSLQGRDVEVAVPRFRIGKRTDLGATLAAMGMPAAFEMDKADFSGMTGDQELFIAKVVHEAVVEVEEQGTVAAAVTKVEGVKSAEKDEEPPPRIRFTADHPFFFVIRDEGTGSILFMGRLANPTK